MRVVQIVFDFGLGGVQKGGIVLGKHLGDLGVESHILAYRGGPRLEGNYLRSASATITGDGIERMVDAAVRIEPDVIHIHDSTFDEHLVERLSLRTKALLVSTPVFGRPPNRKCTMERTLTCCVGLFTHRRFCTWTRAPVAQSFARGIFFAPITPFDPPAVDSRSAERSISVRSQESGLITVGRVARPSALKWHRGNAHMVDALLSADGRFRWVSVGWPEELHRARLRERWGNRFTNREEIADYEALCGLIGRFDIHLFASRHGECFSSSICECAGLGVPTVALLHPLRDCGESEQVLDGVTGFAATNCDEMVRIIRDLGQDTAKLEALKQLTRRHALEAWHARVVAKRLLELYMAYRSGAKDVVANCAWQRDATAFAATYHSRLLESYRSPLKRLLLAAALGTTDRYWTHLFARRCLTIPRIVRGIVHREK